MRGKGPYLVLWVLLTAAAIWLVAACGGDSQPPRQPTGPVSNRVDANDDNRAVYVKYVVEEGIRYRCFIYSHTNSEEGGIWCERAETPSTTTTSRPLYG